MVVLIHCIRASFFAFNVCRGSCTFIGVNSDCPEVAVEDFHGRGLLFSSINEHWLLKSVPLFCLGFFLQLILFLIEELLDN